MGDRLAVGISDSDIYYTDFGYSLSRVHLTAADDQPPESLAYEIEYLRERESYCLPRSS